VTARTLRQFIRNLLRRHPMLVGSLVAQFTTCGKPGCRCTRGQKHGPLYYLYWKDKGRSRSRYVRREQVRAVRRRIRRYQQFQIALAAALRHQPKALRARKERSR
jgi:hypothetical protein